MHACPKEKDCLDGGFQPRQAATRVLCALPERSCQVACGSGSEAPQHIHEDEYRFIELKVGSDQPLYAHVRSLGIWAPVSVGTTAGPAWRWQTRCDGCTSYRTRCIGSRTLGSTTRTHEQALSRVSISTGLRSGSTRASRKKSAPGGATGCTKCACDPQYSTTPPALKLASPQSRHSSHRLALSLIHISE